MIKENIREMKNAIKNDDLNFVKNMIESQSVNINEVTSLGSFLHIAVRKAKYKIAEYLIDAGIDLELLSEYPKITALSEAVLGGEINIVKLLCDKGAKLDTLTSENNPLFFAISGRKVEIAKYLIDAGIDIYATYKIGEIENCDACEWAKKWGAREVYDYLIEKETQDAKKFEIKIENSTLEEIKKTVLGAEDLYLEGEKIICSAKGRRQLIEANVVGISFNELKKI